jgi:hypothetical protein
MRIRWDPVQVMDAADQLEGHVAKIVKPLQRARAAAEEAKRIPHLPDYVKQRLTSVMFDIERVIGGVERTSYVWEDGQSKSSTYITEGSLQRGIEALRKQVPQDALKEAKAQPTLLKIAK